MLFHVSLPAWMLQAPRSKSISQYLLVCMCSMIIQSQLNLGAQCMSLSVQSSMLFIVWEVNPVWWQCASHKPNVLVLPLYKIFTYFLTKKCTCGKLECKFPFISYIHILFFDAQDSWKLQNAFLTKPIWMINSDFIVLFHLILGAAYSFRTKI